MQHASRTRIVWDRAPRVFAMMLLAMILPHPSGRAAEVFARGSSVMLTADVPLKHGDRSVRDAKAGETFVVAAHNAASGNVLIFVNVADQKQVVVAIPQALAVQVEAPPTTAGALPPANAGIPPAAPVPPKAAGTAERLPSSDRAGAPDADVGGFISALDLAREFKERRAEAVERFKGQQVLVKGVVESIRVESAPGGTAPTAVLLLTTGPGLPKIKAFLDPRVSTDATFYRNARIRTYWAYSWWTSLDPEFQVRGTKLMARGVSRYASGSRYTGPWFVLINQGELLYLEGLCEGVMMDVVVSSAGLRSGKP